MTSTQTLHDVVVEAPDGPAALALEYRLAHLCPVAVAHGEHWVVEIPAVDGPEEVEGAIRVWLSEVGGSSTVMHVDGQASTVEAGRTTRKRSRRAYVPPNAGFIG
jgi:hypothetical protein